MMNDFPKISIITPTYNQAAYIESTIMSIIGQNYPNLEYIIIDGGSTDGTVEIIKKYEKHIAYWISEKDSGMYHAINKGFAKSTGEIMGWLNSDDLYQNKSLFIIGDIFHNNRNVNWLMGLPSFYDESGRLVAVQNGIKRWSKYDILGGDFKWIQQESTFWRRNLWEQAGGCVSTNYQLASDLELWVRFFRYEKLFVIETVIAGFRFRSANQKSLDMLDKYLHEVKTIIDNEPLSLNDKVRVISNKLIKLILKFLQRKWLLKKMDDTINGYPPMVKYDVLLNTYR